MHEESVVSSGQTPEEGNGMARMMIENIPDDVRNKFKARCALYETTMRDELIRYMGARGGDVDGLKQLIYTLLTQLVDETVSRTEVGRWIEFQHEFESEVFPEVNDEPESIADAPLDHIPDDYHEYMRERELEVEATGREVTDADYRQIDDEWEKIEEFRAELREKQEDEDEADNQ